MLERWFALAVTMFYVAKHKPEETKHRTLRRACPVRKIAVETADQVDRHRRLARERAAKKRALEIAEQANYVSSADGLHFSALVYFGDGIGGMR